MACSRMNFTFVLDKTIWRVSRLTAATDRIGGRTGLTATLIAVAKTERMVNADNRTDIPRSYNLTSTMSYSGSFSNSKLKYYLYCALELETGLWFNRKYTWTYNHSLGETLPLCIGTWRSVKSVMPDGGLHVQTFTSVTCRVGVGKGGYSSVGIATRYGLGGSGDRIPVEAGFSAHVQVGRGAHPASCTMGTGSLPWVKRTGRGVDHPPHLAPRLKKEQS